MITCQTNDSDNNCLRVQTAREWKGAAREDFTNEFSGSVLGRTEVLLAEIANPEGSPALKEERRLCVEFRHPSEGNGFPDTSVSCMGVWTSAVTSSLGSFCFCHDLMLLMAS